MGNYKQYKNFSQGRKSHFRPGTAWAVGLMKLEGGEDGYY
jgi:hypothetical protein